MGFGSSVVHACMGLHYNLWKYKSYTPLILLPLYTRPSQKMLFEPSFTRHLGTEMMKVSNVLALFI